jgi:hypothetical protein
MLPGTVPTSGPRADRVKVGGPASLVAPTPLTPSRHPLPPVSKPKLEIASAGVRRGRSPCFLASCAWRIARGGKEAIPRRGDYLRDGDIPFASKIDRLRGRCRISFGSSSRPPQGREGRDPGARLTRPGEHQWQADPDRPRRIIAFEYEMMLERGSRRPRQPASTRAASPRRATKPSRFGRRLRRASARSRSPTGSGCTRQASIGVLAAPRG